MNLLEPQPEQWKPPVARTKKYRRTLDNENLEELNNDDREEMTDDFSDSPFLNK